MKMSELNIYQRINKVMQEIDYVKKDATIGKGSYAYQAVTHDAVTATVRGSMVKHGIVMTVTQTASFFDERESDKDGNQAKMRLYHGTYNITFTNIDKPEDNFTVSVSSQAFDNADKAPGKACSYATKYALLKTFLIETGENEESRTFDAYAEPISIKQLEELNKLSDNAGRDEEYILDYLHKTGMTFEKLSDINVGTYNKIKALLNNVIEKNNATTE